MDLDVALLEWAASLHAPWLDRLVVGFTHLGDAGAMWIVLGLALCISKRYRICGLAVLLSLLCSLLCTNVILKNAVARVRPFDVLPITPLVAETSWSFPSGHVSASFAAATAMLVLTGKRGIPALALAVLMAFSRLYVQVHYPSDVLGGAVVGALCGVTGAALARWAERQYERRKRV